MKQLKPIHVLLFTCAVFAVLAPLSWLADGEIIHVAGLEFRFLGAKQLITPKETVKKDISSIVANVDTSAIAAPEVAVDPGKKHTYNSDGSVGAPTGGQLSKDAATSLQMNEKGTEALARLFEKLTAASARKEKIRILHYGDSQIEGDRMTSYLRQRLQTQFGGNGPGTIPAMNVYPTQTYKQTFSPNFIRYTAFGGAKLKSRKYGYMCSAARFTPEYDSTMMMTMDVKEAFIEIEPSKSAYGRARTYNNVKMMYTSCIKPCAVKVYQGANLIHEDSLINDGKLHRLDLSFPETPKKLRYEFSATVSPTIIGFSLEGDYGVQVDNIGMRGSSGTFFGKIDQGNAAKMYADQDVEMVIMQFGGNTVPYLKDSSAVRTYAKQFRGQLYTLKRLIPNATVIVIGPSDMSNAGVGGYETFPMLPYLVSEMGRVSKGTGAAFWDLYSAMGGYNSMPSWVEKGLAGSDYIHFSPRGASIAAQLFFDAFAAEYMKWKEGESD